MHPPFSVSISCGHPILEVTKDSDKMQTKTAQKETQDLHPRSPNLYTTEVLPHNHCKGSHFSWENKLSITLPTRRCCSFALALSLSLVSRSMVMTICTLFSSFGRGFLPLPGLAPPLVFSVILSWIQLYILHLPLSRTWKSLFSFACSNRGMSPLCIWMTQWDLPGQLGVPNSPCLWHPWEEIQSVPGMPPQWFCL